MHAWFQLTLLPACATLVHPCSALPAHYRDFSTRMSLSDKELSSASVSTELSSTSVSCLLCRSGQKKWRAAAVRRVGWKSDTDFLCLVL